MRSEFEFEFEFEWIWRQTHFLRWQMTSDHQLADMAWRWNYRGLILGILEGVLEGAHAQMTPVNP